MSSFGWGSMSLPSLKKNSLKGFAHFDIVFSSRSSTFTPTIHPDAPSRQQLSDISPFVVVLGTNLKWI